MNGLCDPVSFCFVDRECSKSKLPNSFYHLHELVELGCNRNMMIRCGENGYKSSLHLNCIVGQLSAVYYLSACGPVSQPGVLRPSMVKLAQPEDLMS